jgi:hypothetical protein
LVLWRRGIGTRQVGAKITTRDNNPHNPGIELRGNPDSEGHRDLYTSTSIEQSRLNEIAATYAVIAAVFAAAALFDMLR